MMPITEAFPGDTSYTPQPTTEQPQSETAMLGGRTRDERGRFVKGQESQQQNAAALSNGAFTNDDTVIEDSPLEVGQAEGSEQNESGEPADNSLIEAAAAYGFTPEEAESFGDKLPAVMARMDRQAAQLMREQMAGNSEDQTGQQIPQVQKQQQQAQQLLKRLELKLTKDSTDEDTFHDLSSIRDYINEQRDLIEGLAQLVGENLQTTQGFQKQFASQSKSAFDRECEAAFAAINDPQYGGAKPLHLCTKQEQDARNSIVEDAHMLRARDEQRGQRDSYENYVARMYRANNADREHKRATAEATQSLNQQLSQRRKAAIASPTGSKSQKLAPREQAAEHIRQVFAKAGMKTF